MLNRNKVIQTIPNDIGRKNSQCNDAGKPWLECSELAAPYWRDDQVEKISQWQNSADLDSLPEVATSLNSETQEELEMTLLALSYTSTEIQQAIAAISQDSELKENPDLEEWLRKSITWLTGDQLDLDPLVISLKKSKLRIPNS